MWKKGLRCHANVRAGGEKSVLDPMRRLAKSVGGNVARLSTRGTLIDGELRSAQAPTASPPVWFVFTGVCWSYCDAS